MSSTSRKPAPGAPAPRLTRDDWLDAAFEAVVEGGFDHVRVLVIAQRLGVTRGSFYWHFTDHADLVRSLIARWREREDALNRALESQVAADPQADLEDLLEAALAHAGADLKNMRFELALRGLGRRDPAIAQLLVEVDAARLALFESKFRRVARDPKTAEELAVLFYLAIVGSNQALSRPTSPPQAKDYLKGIITRLIIRGPAAR